MISREKWGEIIKDFNSEELPELVIRNVKIPKMIPLRRAISIIGPRRSGKTFAMFQMIKEILNSSSFKADTTQVLYVNFERGDLEGVEGGDLINMMDVLFEIYPKNEKKSLWLFLDEIQNVNGWEKSVRTLIDNEKVQIFISGSSSKLLSREIATSMRGRTITYKILPFSFSEYLGTKEIGMGKYLSKAEKIHILKNLETYIEKGGYPEAVLYPQEGNKILLDIVETIIFRDVVERYKIRNIKLLRILISSLIDSASREFSIHKFYKFIKSNGIKASKDSLYNYLGALNDVFFVFPLKRFSYSYREKEQSLSKIYIIDNGLLTVNGISEKGKLMENLVFVELLRREKEIYYYKSIDGKEVDFVVVEKGKVKKLIQVSYSLDDRYTKEREIKALVKASKELRCRDLLIITYDKGGEEAIGNKMVKYIPLWKWLLEK